MTKKSTLIVASAPAKVSTILANIGTKSGHIAQSRYGTSPVTTFGNTYLNAIEEVEANGFTNVFFSSIKRIGAQVAKEGPAVQTLFDKLTDEMHKAAVNGGAIATVDATAREATTQEINITAVQRKMRKNAVK